MSATLEANCDATIAAPAPPASADVECTVFDAFEKAEALRDEWDRFVESSGGEIYLTFDWCRIWWRHYGRRRTLRLFVFRRAGRIVGLLPMLFERIRVGLVSAKVAKFVGSDFALTVAAPVVGSDCVEHVVARALAQLLEQDGCDLVSFAPLAGTENGAALAAAVRAFAQTCDGRIGVEQREVGCHTVFDFPETFDAYLSSLSKNNRQNVRRNLNLLNKSFAVRVETITDASAAPAELDSFAELHETQWHAEGKAGHFGDWPRARAFNRDLVENLSKLGRVRFTRVWGGDRVLASHYSFVFGGCCFWRLPARAVDPELDRFALGRVGLVKLFESLIAGGVRRLEGGSGHYDYKLQLGARELPLTALRVVRNRRSSRLKAGLLDRWSGLLNLVYYRVFFLKLAPRLRLPKLPLWPAWVRTRF